MADWHYWNEHNEKIGPIRGKELIKLAKEGTVTPETQVEDSEGRVVAAKHVKGLTFTPTINGVTGIAENLEEQDFDQLRKDAERLQEQELMMTPKIVIPTQPEGQNPFSNTASANAAPTGEKPFTTPSSPFVQATGTVPPSAQMFCTNCGNPVVEQAVACMSCGAKPTGHKKFCRHCRAALNPEQVMCTHCGAGISSRNAVTIDSQTLNKLIKPACIAGIALAVLIGAFLLLSIIMDEDKATARKDLQEILERVDQIVRDTNVSLENILTSSSQRYAFRDIEENLEKFFITKRAANFSTWQRAAEKKCPEGEILLGVCSVIDTGPPVNGSDAEEAKWFLKAAEAANWFRKAAEKENAVGQFLFALCNGGGYGVPQNDSEGVKWMRSAAEGGSIYAQRTLAFIYASGSSSVERDMAESVKWLRKAAAKSDLPNDSFALGSVYFEGNGVEKNQAEAIKWFRKAAEKDFLPALARLGKCYYEGIGVSVNKKEAVKWLTKAAENDLMHESQRLLGMCYFEGSGGLQEDKTKAVSYFLKAAEKGNYEAAYQLAVCYHDGTGITKDLEKALYWVRRASEYGERTALEEKIARELAEQKGEEYVPPSSTPSRRRGMGMGMEPGTGMMGVPGMGMGGN